MPKLEPDRFRARFAMHGAGGKPADEVTVTVERVHPAEISWQGRIVAGAHGATQAEVRAVLRIQLQAALDALEEI